MEALSLVALAVSVAALAVSLMKRRKPSLASAVAQGVLYGEQMGKTPAEKLRHAISAVQLIDKGDNGKRDWTDGEIRIAVEAQLRAGRA